MEDLTPISAEVFAALRVLRNLTDEDMQIVLAAWPRKDVLQLSDSLTALTKLIDSKASSFAATFAVFSRQERWLIVLELSPEDRMRLLERLDKLRSSTNALDVGRVIEELHDDILSTIESQQ